MELHGVGLLPGGNRGPEGHDLLTADDLAEGTEILDLRQGELLLLAQVAELLDDRQDLLGGQLGDLLLEALPAVGDVLGRDHRVVLLDEVDEGDRCGGTDVAHGHRVETGREGVLVGATVLRGGHAIVHQRPGEAGPATLRGGDRSGLDRLRGAEVLRVLADEVHDELVEALTRRPGKPVLVGGDEVVGDEPVQEGRVHLIDVVLRAVVDRREDEGLRVEAPPLDLTVEDELERRVLDTRGRTVDLIEEEDAGLGARRVEPVRGSERGDAGLLDAVVIGDADEVALGEERQADVKETLAGALGDRGGDGRLANAVRATQEDGVLDELQDDVEGCEVDRVRGSHDDLRSVCCLPLAFRTNLIVIPCRPGRCTGSPGEVGRRRGDGVVERPHPLSLSEGPGGAGLEILDLPIEVAEHPDVGDRSRHRTATPCELRPEVLELRILTERPAEEGESPLTGARGGAGGVADRGVRPVVGDPPDELVAVDPTALHSLDVIRAPIPELVAPHRDTRRGEGTVLAGRPVAPPRTLTPPGDDVVAAGLRTDETRADDLEVPDRAVLLVLAAKQAIHDVIDRGVRESKAGVPFVCHSFLLRLVTITSAVVNTLYHGWPAVAPVQVMSSASAWLTQTQRGVPSMRRRTASAGSASAPAVRA